MKKNRFVINRFVVLLIGACVGAAVAMFFILASITQHQIESQTPFFNVVNLTDETNSPREWGKNFPLQYEDYLKSVDQIRTRHGGSEAVPVTPSKADPRSIVAQSKVEEDKRLAVMWAGYAFAKDFREERGHAFMLEDQLYTKRQVVAKQPGTCLNCHASTYGIYKKLGEGDIFAGFEKMNQLPYHEAKDLAKHPVACIDCHEPKSMSLRVTRPAFIEGIKALRAHEGRAGFDVNKDASVQEMRTYVCAQCHVEYYFSGKEKRLTYPWSNGLKVEEIFQYYEKIEFADWTHQDTKAKLLKAQHPEFELWSQGIHAKSGVSCADCHMPYKRVGAYKISDHHVRSPLLNVGKSCQSCHHASAEELVERVEKIQGRTVEMRNAALNALVDLISDIKAVANVPGNEEKMALAQRHQRKAQFFIDFVEAENSTGFHAPQEAAKILALAIDEVRKGQLVLYK